MKQNASLLRWILMVFDDVAFNDYVGNSLDKLDVWATSSLFKSTINIPSPFQNASVSMTRFGQLVDKWELGIAREKSMKSDKASFLGARAKKFKQLFLKIYGFCGDYARISARKATLSYG
jgi:hypothetical protein